MLSWLTSKEQKILHFYQNFITTNWHPPTYEEAWKKMKMTAPWVFFHIKKLKAKWYIDFGENTKYLGITPTTLKVPIIWKIACWEPIEVVDDIIDYIEINKNMTKGSSEVYGLIAEGNSMKNAGINDGDYLIIKKQNDIINDGDIGVVIDQSGDNEKATLKRIYKKPSSLILKPANDDFPTTFISKCVIRGKLVWVIRNYQ